MNMRLVIAGVGLAAGCLGLLAAAPWQDAKAKDKPAGSQSKPFSDEEMAAWKKASTPGLQHAELAKMAGKWNVKATSWMKPGAPPEQWSGTADCALMMDGRYLTEDFSGTMSMGPYHGHGMLGFNNSTNQWEHVWLDDMSTGMMVSQGETRGNATELESTVTCPLNGERVKVRTVLTPRGDDERTVEMWSTFPGEAEFQSMILTYQRAGGSKPTR